MDLEKNKLLEHKIISNYRSTNVKLNNLLKKSKNLNL